jgi:2-C-methyl-D-erythritol 4-phosphate cytidylyltransferase
LVGAVIVSGGKGSRMGADVPKQYLDLEGVPVLARTLTAFCDMEFIDNIVLVLPKDEWETFKSLPHSFGKEIHLAAGGPRRQDSVRSGLKALESLQSGGIAVIHDGARPLVTEGIVREGVELCKVHGASACGMKPKDTIKVRGEDGFSRETLNRDSLFSVQTPQVFGLQKILKAHEELEASGEEVTDDTAAYEKFTGRVYLYEGSYENIKITTPEDMAVAEAIISRRKVKG